MALPVLARPVPLACVAGLLLVVAAPSAQKPDPAPILAVAGTYLAAYEHDVVAVVAQEDYRQRVASATLPTRQLRSDLVMIASAERGWIEFRDVFEVDGRKVRDHDDRIVQLFMKPNVNRQQQAAAIVDESARFNLEPAGIAFERTLNVPMEALRFLRTTSQTRSQFEVEGEARTDAGTMVVLRFKEQAEPRLISSPLDTPASGRFWIDPQSGAVVRSELKMNAPNVAATIAVTYARQLDPAIWLPASMDEDYTLLDQAIAISGRATYSGFRRFGVDVATDFKSHHH